jgi:hypothetical protein
MKDQRIVFLADAEYAERIDELVQKTKLASRAQVIRLAIDEAMEKYLNSSHSGGYMVLDKKAIRETLRASEEQLRQSYEALINEQSERLQQVIRLSKDENRKLVEWVSARTRERDTGREEAKKLNFGRLLKVAGLLSLVQELTDAWKRDRAKLEPLLERLDEINPQEIKETLEEALVN